MAIIYYIIVALLLIILIKLIPLLQTKQKKSYGIESTTNDGVVVRSKKEKILGDYFHENEIEYEYEKEIEVGEERMLTDFYLPKYDVYVEYWGLDKLENDTGDEYRARKAHKIELYDKNNLKLISISEDDIPELDKNFKNKLDALSEMTGSKKVSGLKHLLFGKKDIKLIHCTDCGAEIPAASEFCTECGFKF